MASVCSRPPFSFLAAACIACFICCFLIRLPAACCSSAGPRFFACSALKSSHIRHGSMLLITALVRTYVRNSCICRIADGGAAAAFHGQKTDAASIVGRALSCFNDRYVSVHMCIYTYSSRLAYRSFGLSHALVMINIYGEHTY
jgi:hypothetical protein